MNRVHFEGRLIRDPEQRTTSTGKTLCKFGLAVKDARNDNQTYFFDCTAWEPQASQIMATVKKNDSVAIDGRLTTNIYTNRDGKSVKAYDTIVENVRLLGQTNVPPQRSRADQAPQPAQPTPPESQADIKKLFGKENQKPPANIDWMKDLGEDEEPTGEGE